MNPVETMTAQERELADLIVAALNLEIQAAEIEPSAPLYREGLGLDSIDILEIALAVSKKYGFQLRSDDSDNTKIFSSLRNLNEHVQQNRDR
jgi:acyl carrier protein